MKDWYSVQELAGMNGMPGSHSGTLRFLKKNKVESCRKTHGKGREYHLAGLPDNTKDAINNGYNKKYFADSISESVPEKMAANNMSEIKSKIAIFKYLLSESESILLQIETHFSNCQEKQK